MYNDNFFRSCWRGVNAIPQSYFLITNLQLCLHVTIATSTSVRPWNISLTNPPSFKFNYFQKNAQIQNIITVLKRNVSYHREFNASSIRFCLWFAFLCLFRTPGHKFCITLTSHNVLIVEARNVNSLNKVQTTYVKLLIFIIFT